MMDKKSLESVFGARLIADGFNKKGSSWYRQAGDMLQLVNLQKSSWGMQFYVNLCCVPAGMDVEGMPMPKVHKCPIQIRLDSMFPAQSADIKEVFDLELGSISDSERKERATRIVNELVLQFLAYTRDIPSVRQSIAEGRLPHWAANLAARTYLNIGEPQSS
jgi:Domain of unknown function (DUF4304)